MTAICTPLRRILHFGFQRICEVPVVLQRLGRAAGESSSFPPLDGALLLLEAKIQFAAHGLKGLPLLLLGAVLMAALMAAMLPLLVLGRWAAEFLERNSDEVRRQRDGEKCPASAGAVMLAGLAVATIVAVLP